MLGDVAGIKLEVREMISSFGSLKKVILKKRGKIKVRAFNRSELSETTTTTTTTASVLIDRFLFSPF